ADTEDDASDGSPAAQRAASPAASREAAHQPRISTELAADLVNTLNVNSGVIGLLQAPVNEEVFRPCIGRSCAVATVPDLPSDIQWMIGYVEAKNVRR